MSLLRRRRVFKAMNDDVLSEQRKKLPENVGNNERYEKQNVSNSPILG